VHRPSRAAAALLSLALAVLVAFLALPVASSASAATTPVLLVHGFGGSPASFTTMAARFAADGRRVYALDLPGQDNVANARAIRDFVAAHHFTRVDLVAHSMGGLSSRWYIEYLGGASRVAHYVSLGTPQLGLPIACVLPLDGGGQMCPGSAFLAQLNSTGVKRGSTSFTSIFSESDGFVPTAASRLAGTTCLVEDSGVTHGGLLRDARVYRQVLAALGGRCPSAFTAG